MDIRLSRLSLALLAALSAVATVVIISSGGARTPAEVAALAALRQRPVTSAQAPTPAAASIAARAVGSSGSASTASSGAGGTGGEGGAGAGAGGTGAGAGGTTSAAGTASSDSGSVTSTGSGAASDTSGSGAGDTGTTTTTPASNSGLPKVSHVFQIALSATGYAAAFGRTSAAPYLRSLESKGTVLSGYESLGRGELADYLAMVGGQAPNPDTSAGCPKYAEFPQGAAIKANGLVPGRGCVYPETALTVGDQVSSSGHVWRAYIADMGKQACSHPNSGADDDLALPGTEPWYDTGHNPFIYFHSLLDLGDCATDDVDLSHLTAALDERSRTAAYSFIAPGECDDAAATSGQAPGTPGTTSTGTATGTASTTSTSPATATSTTPSTTSTATTPETTSTAATPQTASTATPTTSTTGTTTAATAPTTTSTATSTAPAAGTTPATAAAPCAPGQPVGMAAEDAFLRQWVPRILASPAYRDSGVLVISFAAAGDRQTGHDLRTGALVLSPYAHRGKTIRTAYTPYSLLRSLEDIFGFTPLGRAKTARSFAQAVLSETV